VATTRGKLVQSGIGREHRSSIFSLLQTLSLKFLQGKIPMKQSLLVAALIALAMSACNKPAEEAPAAAVEASAPAVEASAPAAEASAPAADASAPAAEASPAQ
jgi:hypothetical protein